MYIKTNGIVLRETQYRDNDKLLTLMTQELGKLTVKARGAKSARSKNKAACQLLAYSEFTLSEHQGRYTVTETVPLEQFAELRGDLELLALASYFAQVTDTVAQEGRPAAGAALAAAQRALCAWQAASAAETVKAVFELRLACLAGFLPDLRGCLACGREGLRPLQRDAGGAAMRPVPATASGCLSRRPRWPPYANLLPGEEALCLSGLGRGAAPAA